MTNKSDIQLNSNPFIVGKDVFYYDRCLKVTAIDGEYVICREWIDNGKTAKLGKMRHRIHFGKLN